ncbi:unnamed protein product [Durusdinium trenchii]|uniref:DNA (cytosine-5-)-methyltransferase n=2 Tax=Durusdinium trenchii TaxID=1381693 RepID=A0ABP0LAF4_9DINO
MSEGLLHHGPVFPDVQDFHGGDLPAAGVAGGFPCQGVSTAGKQLGLSDARTGLLSHVFRIYDSLPADRREFMVLENVASILHRKSEMREIILFMVKAELRPLSELLQVDWNHWNKLPMSQWLSCATQEHDRERLKTLGNVVVPACGTLGMSLLLRMSAAR